MKPNMKQVAMELLKRSGGGPWVVISARTKDGKLVVRYRAAIADLGFDMSPQLNTKPKDYTKTFDLTA